LKSGNRRAASFKRKKCDIAREAGIAQLIEKQREDLAPALARVDTFSREQLSKFAKFSFLPLAETLFGPI
jgi:hypothetical protein